jgi:hypothetical protein
MNLSLSAGVRSVTYTDEGAGLAHWTTATTLRTTRKKTSRSTKRNKEIRTRPPILNWVKCGQDKTHLESLENR